MDNKTMSIKEYNKMCKDYNKITIETDGIIGKVYIDGKKLDGVKSYKLTHKVHGLPVLELKLNAVNLLFTGNTIDSDRVKAGLVKKFFYKLICKFRKK